MIEHETQTVEEISVDELPTLADSLKLDDWRLVQILCVAYEDAYEFTYSFGGGYALHNLRFRVGLKTPIPSITPYYGAAFLYENEIRDLFGARIERIAPDWGGRVYDIAKGKPFSKAVVPLTSSERPSEKLRADIARPEANEGGAR